MLPLGRQAALAKLLREADGMDILKGIGAWWNGFGALDGDLVAETARASAASLDYVVVKYGNPAAEQAFSAAGLLRGSERFVSAASPAAEAGMLSDAVDAGAAFAVINAEEGGGFDAGGAAGNAMAGIIDAFRARHAGTPLYAALDTRGARTSYPYQQVALARCDAVMPMVYPAAFYPAQPSGYVHQAVADALAPLAGQRLPLHPIIQTYGGIGAAAVLQEIQEVGAYQVRSFSAYTIGHATDAEWQQIVNVRRLQQALAAQAARQAASAAFARVAQDIADGMAAAQIPAADRAIVRFIAALLPAPG